jgi:hypothetical protein
MEKSEEKEKKFPFPHIPRSDCPKADLSLSLKKTIIESFSPHGNWKRLTRA